MTDQPPAGDRPAPEAPEPIAPVLPIQPEAPPLAAPPDGEVSVPQWTSAEAAPATPAYQPVTPDAVPTTAAPAPADDAAPAAAAVVTPPPTEPPPPAAAPPPAQPTWQAPPAAPPKTPEVPGSPGRYFAATVTRVAALLIDTILLGILAGIVSVILGALLPGSFGGGDPFEGTFDAQQTAGLVVVGLGGLVVSYLYFFLSWRSAGKATPGQRVFKMQVGNAFDGATLTARQITIRWLTLFGLGILAVLPILAGIGGLLVIIWDIVLLVTTASSATKQGIHDRWSNSAVVATGPQNTGLAWGCLIVYIVGIILIIFIALAALIAIFAAVYGIN